VKIVYLEKIVACKKEEVESSKRGEPAAAVEKRAKNAPPPRPFREALQTRDTPGPQVIAEIKRASPSRGDLSPGLKVASLARAYREGGAAALSVLTERRFFKGSLEDLTAAREASGLPVLRKDFIIDPWQIYQSRAAGADAVLLIARLMGEKSRLKEFIELAEELSLASLVEVSSRQELEESLEVGADLLGINNRDLQSFSVDLGRTEELASLVPPGVTLVGESGVHSYEDARRLQQAGVHAVLVGEALVRSGNSAGKIREIKGVGSCG